MILLNVVLVFLSAWIAYKQFNLGNSWLAWLNVFSSAVNMAAVAVQLF
jgi:hypothetical protein